VVNLFFSQLAPNHPANRPSRMEKIFRRSFQFNFAGSDERIERRKKVLISKFGLYEIVIKIE